MSRPVLRRMLAFSITLILAATIAAIPAFAATFSDVDPDTELGKAVSLLVDKGIIAGMGDGTFGTKRGLTRAEACTVINKTFGYTEAGTEEFTDVPQSYWGYSYVMAGRRAGYIEGVGGNRFAPDKSLTVEQFCVIMRKITGAAVTGTISSNAKLTISSWAEEAVKACIDSGLMTLDENGRIVSQTVSGGITDTAATCSRGDMAMLLARYVKSDGGEEPALQMQSRNVLPYDWDESLFSYDPATTVMSYNDPAAVTSQGIDVSEYQYGVDWQQVKASGVEFAIIRCGGRGYGSAGKLYPDKYFEANIKGASDAGLKVGVYFYATAVNYEEAYAEADYALSLIKPYKSLITMPVVYDWEIANSSARNANTPDKDVTECYYAFADSVAKAGYTPMAYFNRHIGLKLDLTTLGTTDFWFARYVNTTPDKTTGELPAITTGWTASHLNMWQYTSSGTCPGVSGNVDRIISITK